MAVAPISNLVYKIPRAVLDENAKSMVGIDRGCSLTKAAYVPKNGEGNTATHYAVHCVLFNNSDFEGCLHFLKENALLPATGIIRVTGTGGDKYREVIKNIIGVDVEFMDDSLANIRGSYFLLSHADDRDTLFFPTPPLSKYADVTLGGETKKKQEESLKRFAEKVRIDESDAMFPCIFVEVGSATVISLIEKDGTTKRMGVSLLGGKTLLGLGGALLGTSNYDELMELASIGYSGNVDTTVGDVISDDPKSPYGRLPKELPVFPFGKFVDEGKRLKDCRREDIAGSIVGILATEVIFHFRSAVAREGVPRVIIGGYGTLGEPVRKTITELASRSFMNIPLEPKFLKTWAAGAIGAMTIGVEDF